MKNVIVGVLGCLTIATAAMAATTTKATYPGLTFPDGTVGTIIASSKITKSSTFTHCDYYADNDSGTYLGMYEAADFGTADQTALEQYCYSHYADRY